MIDRISTFLVAFLHGTFMCAVGLSVIIAMPVYAILYGVETFGIFGGISAAIVSISIYLGAAYAIDEGRR